MALERLCRADEVGEGTIRLALRSDGHPLAIYRVDGQLFATDDTCTHGAASLSEDGSIVGDRVECGWHNGQFDIRSGAACAMPCTDALKTWPLHIVDGQVCIELPND